MAETVLMTQPLTGKANILVVDESGRGTTIVVPGPGDLPFLDRTTGNVHLPVVVIGHGATGFLAVVRAGLEREADFLWGVASGEAHVAYTTIGAKAPYNVTFHFFGLESDRRLVPHITRYVAAGHGLVLLDENAQADIARIAPGVGALPPAALLAAGGGTKVWNAAGLPSPVFVGEPRRENIGPAVDAVAAAMLTDARTLQVLSHASLAGN